MNESGGSAQDLRGGINELVNKEKRRVSRLYERVKLIVGETGKSTNSSDHSNFNIDIQQ